MTDNTTSELEEILETLLENFNHPPELYRPLEAEAFNEAMSAIKDYTDAQVRDGRVKELEMLPVMRKGLHTPQKDLDIILLDTVKQRIATIKSKGKLS